MKQIKQKALMRWLVASVFAVSALAGCGGGGDSSTATPPVTTTPPPPVPVVVVPQASILFAGAVAAGSEGADATGSIGAPIELDAGSSSDKEGNALSYAWSIVSKPAGSALEVSGATAKLSFLADTMGTYVFKLRVSNSKGGVAEKNASVLVNNTVPNAVIVVNATFAAQPVTKAPLVVSAGSSIVLDASTSTDADGDKVSTTWELIAKPATSKAALFVTGQSAGFTPDVLGMYQIRARGADGKGAYAETIYQVNAANQAPVGVIRGTVAVISGSNQTVPSGQPVAASGILSYDEGGAGLTFKWAVDSRPADSVAQVVTPGNPILSFTPDKAGAYVLSLSVSNGRQTVVAYLNLNVYLSTSSVLALPFTPLEAKYNKALDRLMVVTAEPDALQLIKPADGVTTSISLPAGVKTFSFSPDGKLAGVLHEGVVSLVDLVEGKVLRSSRTGGAQTEIITTNDGVVFLTGQSLGSSVRPVVAVMNAATGAILPGLDYSNGSFGGTVRGVYAHTLNKVIVSSNYTYGSPSYFTVDPKTNAILTSGYNYSSEYPMGGPYFLSAKEDLLFTGGGTYFNTDTLKYVGRFVLTSTGHSVISMSYSPVKEEALVLEGQYVSGVPVTEATYQTSYKRYSGEFLFPAGQVSLPFIGGQASYGIGVYHTAAGDPLALVQTGGAQKTATRVKYYLVYR
ncbi:PKD domain-containing protein [Janthinobacterium aquaticum]|uniref:PKD domain-containing protein n=1 Tax=Janthinobacterium sp. FT58W TaxID=2654254 RepID=UPI001264DBB1|nr:hypothetical protein [Janthinobacterium sp. FT58W]KAB8042376.1 hypothetical protein GCM43_12570 [Janthinobacterium sp. FT58W]